MREIGMNITRFLLHEVALHAIYMASTLYLGNTICLSANQPIINQIDRNFVHRYFEA